jgi:hypothetical protein
MTVVRLYTGGFHAKIFRILFRSVQKIAKSDHLVRHVCPSTRLTFRPSVRMENPASIAWIFMKFHI